MKASAMNFLQAMKFEAIVATKSEGFASRDLFAIPGYPGVWRRVTRTSTSLSKKRAGAELAMFEGAVIELILEKAITHELNCAGLLVGTSEQQTDYIKESGTALPSNLPAENPEQMKLPGLEEPPAQDPPSDAQPAAVLEFVPAAESPQPEAQEQVDADAPAPAPSKPKRRQQAAASND